MKRLWLTQLVFTIVLTGLLVGGCGGNDTQLFASLNGRNEELRIEGVEMVAFGLQSSTIYGGVPTSGNTLYVQVLYFLAGSPIVDHINILVRDVTAISRGQQLYVDNANITVEIQMNGIEQIVTSGSSVIMFHSGLRSSNSFEVVGIGDGQTVALDIQLALPEGIIHGTVEGKVRRDVGF